MQQKVYKMQNCLTCKFWFEIESLNYNGIKLGDCLRLAQDDVPIDKLIMAKIEEEKSTGLMPSDGFITGENFGCTNHDKIQ